MKPPRFSKKTLGVCSSFPKSSIDNRKRGSSAELLLIL